MEDEFAFPDAELYHCDPLPPSNPSKTILSLPTEVIVDIARLNHKTAVALMCTNRVLHAAGVTALYAKVFLRGTAYAIQNADPPRLVVPRVLSGLLARPEHSAALRYLKILSMPYYTEWWAGFRTLVYRLFERANGLVRIDVEAKYEFWRTLLPGEDLLQPIHPQNLRALHLHTPKDHFAPHLLTTPSLKEVYFSDPCWKWGTPSEHNQGPYLQVTSLRYIHGTVEPNTMIGDLLGMAGLFPSVERLEVEICRSPKEFLEYVPQMANSWAKVKQLCLEFVWDDEAEEPPIIETTKNLLMQAGNRLCPTLDTGEVRYTRQPTLQPAPWMDNRGRFTWTGGSIVASFSPEEH